MTPMTLDCLKKRKTLNMSQLMNAVKKGKLVEFMAKDMARSRMKVQKEASENNV